MESGNLTHRKYYFMGAEVLVSPSGEQTLLKYITANGKLVAIVRKTEETQEIFYPILDRQGSIIAILNSDNEFVETRSYDAWGRLRNSEDWTDYQDVSLAITSRSYTGHEYLPDHKLINMNGRLYDPQLGRMLSPDMYVQNPGNSQNYNRYSYVLNNPLKYTDPSGERASQEPKSKMASDWYSESDYYLVHGTSPEHEENMRRSTGQGNGSPISIDGVPGTMNEVNLLAQTGNIDAGSSIQNASLAFQNQIFTFLVMSDLNALAKAGDGYIEVEEVKENAIRYKVADSQGRIYNGPPLPQTFHKTTIIRKIAFNSGGSYERFRHQESNTAQSRGNSSLALDIGGGIYGGLQGLTSSQGYWLGKNGKYYSNNWGGNQYTGSRSVAFKVANQYKMAGRATVVASALLGGYMTYEGYVADGGQFGYNAQMAAASSAGSIIGGIAGAEAGALIGAGIGAWFGGVGAIPGAVIGGVIGGFGFGMAGGYYGGQLGGSAVNYYHGR